MSTPAINVTSQQTEYMYKKTLGVAYELPGSAPSQETISSLPYIINTQVMSNDIPTTAPSLDSSTNLAGGGVKYDTTNPNIFYYAANFHQEFAKNLNELYWTYNINSFNFEDQFTDINIYTPKMVKTIITINNGNICFN